MSLHPAALQPAALLAVCSQKPGMQPRSQQPCSHQPCVQLAEAQPAASQQAAVQSTISVQPAALHIRFFPSCLKVFDLFLQVVVAHFAFFANPVSGSGSTSLQGGLGPCPDLTRSPRLTETRKARRCRGPQSHSGYQWLSAPGKTHPRELFGVVGIFVGTFVLNLFWNILLNFIWSIHCVFSSL
jgi:hypothetical protein